MKKIFLLAFCVWTGSCDLAYSSHMREKKDHQARIAQLTPLQKAVTQKDKTEPPFKNKYWDNKRKGIYVDVVSGEPLFSSQDKYDSGTGWPSFSKTLEEQNITTKTDRSLFLRKRTEVRSKNADSHLGHVFDDGPQPTGKRYCINSASLDFIPYEDLEKKGYGKYKKLFEGTPTAQVKESVVLAGGCFWGMEDLIRKQKGVLDTTVGYSGGDNTSPTYDQVKTGSSGHAESVKVTFDPSKTSLAKILDFYFRIHDPTTLNRQGNDVGSQYRSAIFVSTPEQKKEAQAAIERVKKSQRFNGDVVTQVEEQKGFYPAEESHQDYLQKNPGGYTCHFIRPE